MMGNMIWTPSHPAQGDYLQPMKMRENLAAIAAQNLGVNLLGDPTFICWPDTDGGVNKQGYWRGLTGGSGTVDRETGGGNYLLDGMSAKLTYSSGYTTVYQVVLTTNADMVPFYERYISVGVWLKTSVASNGRVRIYDGIGSTDSFHTGGGGWEWITATRQIADSATYLQLALTANASGVVYVDGATMVFGQIPPPDYIPAMRKTMDIGFSVPGNPPAVGQKFRWVHNKPFVVRSTYIGAKSNVAGQALIGDVEVWDGSWLSMYSTRPDIDVAAARGYAEPDGTYRYRCFMGGGFGADVNNRTGIGSIDQAPTSGGEDPVFQITCETWDRPLDVHNLASDY